MVKLGTLSQITGFPNQLAKWMPALKPQQFVETYIGGVEKVDRDLHKWSICEIQNGSHFLHPADKNGEGKVIFKNSRTVIFVFSLL